MALLDQFRVDFRAFLPIFWDFFLRLFCDFLIMFWEVECKIKQNDAGEGKNMQIPAKNSPKICKIVQKQAFLSSIKHLFCLKKNPVKIDVSTCESVQQVGVPGRVLSGFSVFLCNLMKV